MTDPAWESWLAGRFPGYLLGEAEGRARPVDEVARALGRLAGDHGALTRLAALGFLLDPNSETERFVADALPRYLAHVYPVTHRTVEERRGSARGHIDWARTQAARTRAHDPSLFVTNTSRRTFQTPDLLLVRWLLDRIVAALREVRVDDDALRAGYVGRLGTLHRHTRASLAHAALRDLPVERPTPAQAALASQSRDAPVRLARKILALHDTLLPEPDGDALVRTVARYALTPFDVNRRFELFVLLCIIDAVDRCARGAPRRDALIAANRSEVCEWILPTGRLRLFYDQSPEAGVHADVLAYYFRTQATVRPDFRLVFDDAGGRRELYVDAKNSVAATYLATSHLKMLGYVADRRSAFPHDGTKVVLVCPVEIDVPPRDGDEVVYVGASGCGMGGHLDGVVSRWIDPRSAR